MFVRLVAFIKKPVIVIAALNVATVAAITVAWNSAGFQEVRAAGTRTSSTSYARVYSGRSCTAAPGRLTQSPLQLKARAERVFRKEHAEPRVGGQFLIALSMALGFRNYERVEALLNQYDCGNTL